MALYQEINANFLIGERSHETQRQSFHSHFPSLFCDKTNYM